MPFIRDVEKGLTRVHSKGPSGKIGYPDYIETWHDQMLGTGSGYSSDLTQTLTAWQATSPYTGVNAADQSTFFGPANTRMGIYTSLVDAFSVSTEWGSFMAAAQNEADDTANFPKIDLQANQLDSDAVSNVAGVASTVAAGAAVDAVVLAHEAQITARIGRAYNRLSGLMAENGALHSAWIMGLAQIEVEAGIEADKYDGELRHDLFKSVFDRGTAALYEAALRRHGVRDGIVADGSFKLLDRDRADVEEVRNTVHMQAELSRMEFTAENEQTNLDLQYDVADAQWDMLALEKAAAILGAPGGAQPIADKTPKAQAALSGALTGVATGAAIGAPAGGPSLGLSVAVGALVGGIAGYFS